MVGTPAGVDRTALYRTITDLIAPKSVGPEAISITGAPVAEALLGLHILEDLGVPRSILDVTTRGDGDESFRVKLARRVGLVPLALLVMSAIFFISFRSVMATMLPLMEVGACLIFVFGLMGLCNVPVYLTIAVMPVLLTAMGVTDEIHVFSRYFAMLHENPGVAPVKLVEETMEEMCVPITNTSLTTAIGFVSFAFSPVAPVQAFGIFTGIGVLFCMVWSLTVIPAMLVLIDPKWFRIASRVQRAAEHSPFARLSAFVVRRRVAVLAVVVGLVALTPFGLRQLVIQDSWINGFARDSQFARSTRYVNEQFHGIHQLFVSFDASKSWTGTIPTSAVSASPFTFPAGLTTDAKELIGSWLYLYLEKPSPTGTNTAPITDTWRSIIESATMTNGQIRVTTAYRDIQAGVWLQPAKVDRVRYEIRAQPHLPTAHGRRHRKPQPLHRATPQVPRRQSPQPRRLHRDDTLHAAPERTELPPSPGGPDGN